MKKLAKVLAVLLVALLISCLSTATSQKENLTSDESSNPKVAGSQNSQETVQVLLPTTENLQGTESIWLPGQIQDRLKANMQEYLNLRTVVDSNAEKRVKQIQAESESGARDGNTAIELGKIATAKYGLFSKIRKTSSGYSLSVDYTDLTTGVQMASSTSKEYSKPEYLYGSTGAVDEVTLALANKLGIKLNDLTINLLASGSADFSVDMQMDLAKQNEEQYRKLMNQYDKELKKLSVSNDLSAVENKKKIEAEKALLEEKQKSEQKRIAELAAQKQQAEEDAKLEAERSIELKTQRDNLAKQAASKAAEVRKLKLDKQGVLGQITVIESKKKAVVEIRQAVENRHVELYNQMIKDKKTEEDKIKNAPWSTVELNNGQPTEAAKQRRKAKVADSNNSLQIKFFADCDAVKKAAGLQDAALRTEILTDQEALKKTRTVSSMNDELKIKYGLYDSNRNGWITYLDLYSDGVLLYSDRFLLGYEALAGKKAPNMATELNDAVITEYANTVDMYNSLLTRGDPILFFELDYNVETASEDKPSQYSFTFIRIRAINTISGKTVQTTTLDKTWSKTMKPIYDLREFAGIADKEKAKYNPNTYKVEYYMVGAKISRSEAIKMIARETGEKAKYSELGIKMIPIPGKNFEMMSTEVTQKLYRTVMGVNPSMSKGDNLPVENVSWYDAVKFCNMLSQELGRTEVYIIDGKKVTINYSADGFRLPDSSEWNYSAKGGSSFTYSGSNNIDEVAWYSANSRNKSHPVSQLRSNGYGLYDMSGNVGEWCWTGSNDTDHYVYGGSFHEGSDACSLGFWGGGYSTHGRFNYIGFRVVRTVK